eukprot:scaffold660281_cov177-Attheya_sp.AAC.1
MERFTSSTEERNRHLSMSVLQQADNEMLTVENGLDDRKRALRNELATNVGSKKEARKRLKERSVYLKAKKIAKINQDKDSNSDSDSDSDYDTDREMSQDSLIDQIIKVDQDLKMIKTKKSKINFSSTSVTIMPRIVISSKSQFLRADLKPISFPCWYAS